MIYFENYQEKKLFWREKRLQKYEKTSNKIVGGEVHTLVVLQWITPFVFEIMML